MMKKTKNMKKTFRWSICGLDFFLWIIDEETLDMLEFGRKSQITDYVISVAIKAMSEFWTIIITLETQYFHFDIYILPASVLPYPNFVFNFQQ